MKKITSLAAVLLLSSMSLTANAQTLGEAEVIEPSGKYVGTVYNVTLKWNEDVEMVAPLTDDFGKEYFTATISVAGHEAEIKFNYRTQFDYETWQETELKNEVTANVYSELMNPDTYQPYMGEVTVTIPAGVVKNAAGSTNPAQIINFTVMEEAYYNYTVTPESYSTVNPETLKNVTITFNGTITLTEPAQSVKITSPDYVESKLPADKVTATENALVLDLSDLQQGYNDITVPSGFVIVTDASGSQAINANILLSYTVWDGMAQGQVIYPQAFNISSLEEPIQVTWDCPITLSETVLPTLYCYSAGMYGNAIPADAVSIEGDVLKIDLSSYAELVSTGSNMEVTLPVGLVEGEQGMNPVQNVSFYYYKPYDQEAEYEMEDGIMMISWPFVNDIGSSYSENIYVVLTDGSKRDLTWSQYGSAGDAKIPSGEEPFANERVEVDIDALELEAGDYTLVIPECIIFFYMPDYTTYCNPLTEIPFTVEGGYSGIDQMMESDGLYRVYNLQGINVLNTQDKNALNNLPAGIYIINGKKTLLRK